MTTHKGAIVILLIVIVGVRLLMTGKLKNSFSALFGSGSSAGTGTTGTTGTSGGGTLGHQAPLGSFLPAGDFLHVAPSSFIRGDSLPGIAALDQSGLSTYGASLAGDFDYGVPMGTAVFLPGGSSDTWTIQKSWEEGRTAVVRNDKTGGILEFLHLSADYFTGLAGVVVHGGAAVGQSGAPSGPLEAGSGAHLAVIADTKAYSQLAGE